MITIFIWTVPLLDPLPPHRPAAHDATPHHIERLQARYAIWTLASKYKLCPSLALGSKRKAFKIQLRQTGQSENCTLQKRKAKQHFDYDIWVRLKPVAHSRRCPCWHMGTVRHAGRSGTRPPVWNSPTRVPLVIVHLSSQHIAVACLTVLHSHRRSVLHRILCCSLHTSLKPSSSRFAKHWRSWRLKTTIVVLPHR